jgi:methionine aminopeptidase
LIVAVNDEVEHGIPSNRHLRDGDIISFQVGVRYKGWYAQQSMTFGIGTISDKISTLPDGVNLNSWAQSNLIISTRTPVQDKPWWKFW